MLIKVLQMGNKECSGQTKSLQELFAFAGWKYCFENNFSLSDEDINLFLINCLYQHDCGKDIFVLFCQQKVVLGFIIRVTN